MMDKVEQELRILLSEKEQADRQIGSYLELQVKVQTVIFTAAAVAGGWLFAQQKSTPPTVEVRGAAVLTLAFLGCISTLQGIVNYGIVLGYIRYKHLKVGDRMGKLLDLKQNPLAALGTIAAASSNRVVMAASFISSVFVLGVSGGLLGYGFSIEESLRKTLFPGGLWACVALWLATLLCGLGLVRSMTALEGQVRRSATPLRDGDRGEAP